MVWIAGGTFQMGSDEHYPEEAPAHRVTVDGFWMDRHTTTNREFALFVRKTWYVANHYNWWACVPGADWRHPQGPGSSVKKRPDHPVLHVAWADVEAYARWVGQELPTEAEWEFAARGGLDGAEFAWGGTQPGPTLDDQHLAGQVLDPQHQTGRLGAHRAGGLLPAQPLRPAGYDRQRLGMDRRVR
jgi:formylglycine-generating enzyme required for sulfatase activity